MPEKTGVELVCEFFLCKYIEVHLVLKLSYMSHEYELHFITKEHGTSWGLLTLYMLQGSYRFQSYSQSA